MIGESILELHETNATYECIKSYEYDDYQPITGTQLNSAGQITTITIGNQGDVLKANNTRYADADLVALTNNGFINLFSSLNTGWTNSGHVNYPGQATSLLGLTSYSTTYHKGCGLAHCWFPVINTNAAANNIGFYTRQGWLIRNPNPKGSFQCAIPMRHIRFCG